MNEERAKSSEKKEGGCSVKSKKKAFTFPRKLRSRSNNQCWTVTVSSHPLVRDKVSSHSVISLCLASKGINSQVLAKSWFTSSTSKTSTANCFKRFKKRVFRTLVKTKVKSSMALILWCRCRQSSPTSQKSNKNWNKEVLSIKKMKTTHHFSMKKRTMGRVIKQWITMNQAKMILFRLHLLICSRESKCVRRKMTRILISKSNRWKVH